MEEYKIKQYERLTKEISETLNQISSIEKYSIVFSGGIYTWIFTNQSSISKITNDCSISVITNQIICPNLVFFIPCILIILLGIISYGMYKRIELIGEYIKVEYEDKVYSNNSEEMNKNTSLGWESFLTRKNSKILISSRKAMWLLHFTGTLLVAIYFNLK